MRWQALLPSLRLPVSYCRAAQSLSAWRLAWVAFELGDESLVRPQAERAIARLERLGDGADLAATLEFLGNYDRRRGRLDEAEPLLQRAVEMATRIGARVTEGHARLSLGSVGLQHGSVADALAFVEQGFVGGCNCFTLSAI